MKRFDLFDRMGLGGLPGMPGAVPPPGAPAPNNESSGNATTAPGTNPQQSLYMSQMANAVSIP